MTKKFFLFALAVYFTAIAHAQSLPQQAQASHLAVPVKFYPYASAVIVTQCHLAVAVIFADHNGVLHPQHLKDLSYAQLLEKVTQNAPSDAITEVTVTCPDERST